MRERSLSSCSWQGNFLRNNDLALRTIVYTMQRWSQLDACTTEAVFFRHEVTRDHATARRARCYAHEQHAYAHGPIGMAPCSRLKVAGLRLQPFARHQGYFGAVGALLQSIDPHFVREMHFNEAASSQPSFV